MLLRSAVLMQRGKVMERLLMRMSRATGWGMLSVMRAASWLSDGKQLFIEGQGVSLALIVIIVTDKVCHKNWQPQQTAHSTYVG